jgi:hypothetical protein
MACLHSNYKSDIVQFPSDNMFINMVETKTAKEESQPFDPHKSQNALVLESLIKFYNRDDNLEVALNAITESQLSLRIIDWFVTNYAKKYYTTYIVKTENKPNKRLKVYTDYRLALSSYKKRRFDPFCRRDRIEFPCNDNTVFQTTIGQMNFFKWVIENKILQYITDHYNEIEEDMYKRNSTRKKNPKNSNETNKTRKKREELSFSATKFIKKEMIALTLDSNVCEY